MEIVKGLEGLRSLPKGVTLSVGNFDGVHRGHTQILRRARELCGAYPLAVATFEPHPLTVLNPGKAPPRLTSVTQKEALLRRLGVDHLVVLPPEPSVLGMDPEQFWKILRDEVGPRWLVEGRSFTFGKGRGGNVSKLRDWSAETSVKLEVIEPISVALMDMTVVEVSSSLVRWLVQHGRMRDVAACLGRPYELQGEVIKGHQRGRTIGMPTANLRCEQLVPMDGVYAARCVVEGRTYPVGLSVGTMPTFGENARQVEAHLIGFEGDLYGKVLSVEVLDWVREQRKYHTLEALMDQMKSDLDFARERVGFAPEKMRAGL